MITVKTYDEIMNSYLNKIPKDMDTREGTLAHIVMSATALSVSDMYEQLKIVEDNAYGDTAVGEYLDKTVAILGMSRLGASKAIVKLEGDAGYVVGEKVASEDQEYKIISVEDDYYLAECTKSGSVGNAYLGEVVPVSDSADRDTLKITEIVAPGRDNEDDESLRKRYVERINCPICAGNVSYYKNAIHSLSGVGGIKVIPVPDGAGTVKVIITNDDYDVADEALIAYVKNTLDPEETSGQGYGVVPIGHKVSVESVEKVNVDIQLEVTGTSSQTYYLRFGRSALPNEFKKLNQNWDAQNKLVLWDRIIEDYFFSLDGVEDVNVISINGVQNRLILEENQILGDVTLNGV